MTAYTGHAGSKVILLGEHGVVHGTDALVVGLQTGLSATATQADEFSVSIPDWSLSNRDILQKLCEAFGRMFDILECRGARIAFKVNADIPSRAGLGASASLGMACARATCGLLNLDADEELIFNAVLSFENVFHHNSSGVDIRAVARTGCGVYHRKRGYQPLAAPIPSLMVIHSGAPGATRDTVLKFERRLQTHRLASSQLKRIQDMVRVGVDALMSKDTAALGKAMNEVQDALCWFDMSTDALDHICQLALNAGALGAKLTGGGGGGCAIALLAEEGQREEMKRKFADAGYRVVM
ncbi:MAG: mevalonate kinase [Deltaproteobacteria bacterium]|nr:mevalonate kinase [Deltaproteobacteria bacterium]